MSKLDELRALETVIEEELDAFSRVGAALLAIRDGKKYKAAGYSTFDEYCARRWDLSRSQGHRLVAAAEAVTALSPTGDIPQPHNERQVRPMTPLRSNPAAVTEVWTAAVDAADGAQPTHAQVEQAVNEYKAKSEPDVLKRLVAASAAATPHALRGLRSSKTRKPNAVVENVVTNLRALAHSLSTLDVEALPDEAPSDEWLEAIEAAMRSLRVLRTGLRSRYAGN